MFSGKLKDKFDTRDMEANAKREKHLLNGDLDICYWRSVDQPNYDTVGEKFEQLFFCFFSTSYIPLTITGTLTKLSH